MIHATHVDVANFSINKIKGCFPFPEFRENQEDVLKDIVYAFSHGVDVYLLNAAVGFGKSPIGIALSRMTSEKDVFVPDKPFGAYYSTPQKVLQDQLNKDFHQYINVIKGRAAYSCTVLPNNTCKDGMCQFDDNYECDEWCEYIEARDAAVNGQIACSNLAYLLVVPKFMFDKRELLIIDEAHSINDWALGHVGCTLSSYNVGGKIPKFNHYWEYIKWLNGVHENLSDDYHELNDRVKESDSGDSVALGLKEARDNMKIVLDKVAFLLSDYDETKEEWIWQIADEHTKKERIKFEPITAGRFLEDIIWWRGQKKLLMSGTIFPELFIEEAGLDNTVCEYKEVESIFPVENRPIYYWPAGKMTLRERERTIPKMIERVFTIINKYPNDKGIIHCGSYKIAEDLYAGLSKLCGDKVRLQERANREGSLRSWMNSDEPSLFLSVNMTEGIDLKDDLCRYQIVGKVQFPYLGDARIKARMNMIKYRCDVCGKVFRTTQVMDNLKCTCGEGVFHINMDIYIYSCSECGKKLISGIDELIPSDACSCGNEFTKSIVTIDGSYWYDSQAIIDLVQSYGRPVRTPTDKADMWILDSSFMPLYKKRYTTFPKMFKEAVRIIK